VTIDTRPPAAFGKRMSVRTGMNLILASQFFVAAMIVLVTVFQDSTPRFLDRTRTPGTLQPVTPGDQNRPYTTDVIRLSPQPADTDLQLPDTGPIPDRLTFSQVTDKDYGLIVIANGAIREDDLKRFQAYLDGLERAPDYIALNSPGGRVSEALALGQMIRAREIKTLITASSICLSSCPYVFAGGVARLMHGASVIGLHQHYFEQPKYLPTIFAVEAIQAGQAATMEFLIEMGVDPALAILGMKTAPDDIYVLLTDEAVQYRLATGIIDN